MKKQALAKTLLAELLIAAIVGWQSVNSVSAQFDAVAEPPVITIISPENKTYATNNLTFSFNASIGWLNKTLGSITDVVDLTEVYYVGDWQQNNTYVSKAIAKTVSFSCDLMEIPEGSHEITVVARERIPDPSLPLFFWVYSNSSLSVNFTIDTIIPSVSVLSPQSSGYVTGDVSLNFTVSEAVFQVAYSLDGNANVVVAGGTLLYGLAVGEHNVTVYAWDEAGNVGASETVCFTVAESFLVTLITVALVSVVAVSVLAGILLYSKRHKLSRF